MTPYFFSNQLSSPTIIIMKKNILILLAFIATFSVYSCNNDNNANNSNETEEFHTRAAIAETPETENEESAFGFITQKWELGDEYIDLDKDGTFEAIFDGKHLKGKWGLSTGTDDQKTLELIGEEDESAEHNKFHRTYELINVSYDRLVAIDSDGNKINFYPEK